ncbi:DivIVA domain-containing protein [Amycolatopsis palatopharyngis]|uniref:DivIVA domain-containing protein n=1 Tax=Amycolatopsis palatopharyngis TaxID=187982 RepID=UPI000E25E945|nr:DivIVA domain-containing protein [Amycolatopsis palatopharyngis]
MTAIDSRGDVVPLPADFDREWRGFSRAQVNSYVDSVEAELRLVAADRDAAVSRAEQLVRRLDDLRAENEQLQQRIDRICRTPIEPDGLQDRMRRMVELAREEAAEIIGRAKAVAEDSWVSAEQAATRLRERYDRLTDELDSYRRHAEAERHELLRRTEAQVEAMRRRTEQRSRELDEQAANRRRQIEQDFELAMIERRNEATRVVDQRKSAAAAEADRLVREARRRADRLVGEAREQVEILAAVRDRSIRQLSAARELLDDAEAMLSSEPQESPQAVPVGSGIPSARQPV